MNKPENYNFSINKVLDIEENIWSPKYGLKGKVDVSVQASFHPSSSTKGFVFIYLISIHLYIFEVKDKIK